MSERYEVRWRNGCWKIFDWHQYRDVMPFALQRDAEAALKKLK